MLLTLLVLILSTVDTVCEFFKTRHSSIVIFMTTSKSNILGYTVFSSFGLCWALRCIVRCFFQLCSDTFFHLCSAVHLKNSRAREHVASLWQPKTVSWHQLCHNYIYIFFNMVILMFTIYFFCYIKMF